MKVKVKVKLNNKLKLKLRLILANFLIYQRDGTSNRKNFVFLPQNCDTAA